MPEGIDCTGNFALFYVGSDTLGTSSWDLLNVSRWVLPGWRLHRTEKGDITLTFHLANPEGKFTYSSSPDFIELKRDLPVVLSVNGNVYFYGIVDKPPVDDTPEGSTVKVTCVGRQGLLRYADVTKRYLIGEWGTVEDIIYDIIYEATTLHDFYDITYVKADARTRHPLMRDFIFNNKDAHTVINELVDFHNLRFYMDTDTIGVDNILTSRIQTANVTPAITTIFSEDNCLNFNKERGSEIFFNRVKVIARTDEGDVMVAEQQDVQSIVEEGLNVRPVEDMGMAATQSEVQAYAEYLIAKYSKSNYTTTISVDPTKFENSLLWNLRPLDVIKVTHAKLGLGTDEKYRVQEVTIIGDTDQITGYTILLNHIWRNEQIMRFEEQVSVYDRDQTIEDEELIHSRIMSATVNIKGYFNIIDDTPTNHYYPSDQLTNDGFNGFTDHGKQVLKANWLTDPEYSIHNVPSNPYTMRPTTIWPLDSNGWVIPRYHDAQNAGQWGDDTNGFNTSHGNGTEGEGLYHSVLFSQDIVATSGFDVEGLLVCSRVGGKVEEIVGAPGTGIHYVVLDDPKYLRIGMSLTIIGRNPSWPSNSSADEFTTYTFNITDVEYDTHRVYGHISGAPSLYDPTATYWFCDAMPVAYVDYDTAVTFANTDTGKFQWYLRFYNETDTYGEVNLSIVTAWGLYNIGERFDSTTFGETFDGDTPYTPPIYLAVGKNESDPRFEALNNHHELVDEVARSTAFSSGDQFTTSVSESAKVTAKFRSDVVPPQIIRGTLTSDANSAAKTLYLDDTTGLLIGDAIFFSESPTGGDIAEWVYTETSLSPDFIEGVNNTTITLRHGLKEAKKGNVTDGYTKWTTGKLKEREVATIREFGLFDAETDEREVEGYYLGKRTGVGSYPADVVNPTGDPMGFGDYQYDGLQDEDSLAKSSDTPPSFFSDQLDETMDYLVDVTGVGYSTVPLLGMFQGSFPETLTFDEEDNYGRQIGLKRLLRRLNKVSGPLGAMNVSPLSRMSYIETTHKAHTLIKEYYPSKWRLIAGATGWGKTSDHSSWWTNVENILYAPDYAAQLFVFAVDNDIEREDFKQINVVWRGTARSWSDGEYRDGVNVYIWHAGDHQPTYTKNDDGTYETSSRVGDVKTYNQHWEKVEMVRGDGNEHDSIIPSTEEYNSIIVLRSNISGGGDNHVGINKLGYCLMPGNKIYILVTAKHRADDQFRKTSTLTTDFMGLSIGTSHIFDSDVKAFRKGVDFYFDPEWDFIAWPPLDYTWDGNSWEGRFNLVELATLTHDSGVGTSQIWTTGNDWLIPGSVVLLVNDTGQNELIRIAEGSNNVNPKLEAPLSLNWEGGDKVYGHINNNTEFPIQVLKKAITPDFPTRAYVRQALAAVEPASGNLDQSINSGGYQLVLSNTAGFVKGDRVMLWRSTNEVPKITGGFEERTVMGEVEHDTNMQISWVRRSNVDAGPSAYVDTKTEVGIVRFPSPEIEENFALSWSVEEEEWLDGDANGGKWRARTGKWGLKQYPDIEVISGDLSSMLNPLASVGEGYVGWGDYGGPGIKVEYYDAENGFIWLTKAGDVTLREMTTDNTDSESNLRDYNFYQGIFKIRTSAEVQLHIYRSVAADFGDGYNSYGNDRSESTVQSSIPAKVARNSPVTIEYTDVFVDAGYHPLYVQFALAETIVIPDYETDAANFEDNDWEVKIKYRCLESGTSDGTYKTCLKSTTSTQTGKWYLDAPFLKRGYDTDIYNYRDDMTGKVFFVIDVVCPDYATHSDSPDGGGSEDITAGDTTFTLAAQGTNFRENDLVLFVKSGGAGYEIAQVNSISGDTMTVTTAFKNSYGSSDTIYWWFFESPASLSATRCIIDAVQVYRPFESGDKPTVVSNMYRSASYTAKFARRQGNLLVYSLLKDYSVFRPVKSDMADTLQFIQEVKFKYLEKDMV